MASHRWRCRSRRRFTNRDNTYPATTAGISSANDVKVWWSTASVTASTAIDSTDPTRKNPLIVPRNRAPLVFCHTNAIGDPPIDVAVPSTPDVAPASTRLRGAAPAPTRRW